MTLPLRDGVAPSFVILPAGCGGTLLDFLTRQFPAIPRLVWENRLARGEVVDERGRTMQPDTACRQNAKIFYYRELPPETPIPFEESILHVDAQLLAMLY